MEQYPWWNEKQKILAAEAKEFADDNIPRGEEVIRTKEFPADLVSAVGKRGWFGAAIPETYEGMGMGITGCCTVIEELSRVCSALAAAYYVSMFAGVKQLTAFGNEAQKKQWLPRIAKGTLGGICVTEPGVGSDAASIQTTALRKGDKYVVNGKKRFITNAGVAGIYCLYAKTSDRPEDRGRYQHLSAFIVEKESPGLSVEKINELSGWVSLPNGSLDFNDIRVPVANCIGQEGDGWRVLVDTLNFERTLFTAGMLGPMREAIRCMHALEHCKWFPDWI